MSYRFFFSAGKIKLNKPKSKSVLYENNSESLKNFKWQPTIFKMCQSSLVQQRKNNSLDIKNGAAKAAPSLKKFKSVMGNQF
ncbi:hypothetical protein [Polluticoccus soli]|uniref:hypothetical protein n=1 Tax=Polluticoccus soli TaxID=3034150 RepID=UPI0023E282C0|nr:hypothetical protein [Flavipsychrobacter sp. JY13-12]